MGRIDISGLIGQLKTLQGVMGNINITAQKGSGAISSKYDAASAGFDIEETLQVLSDINGSDGDNEITDDEIIAWQSKKGFSSSYVEQFVKSELLTMIAAAKNVIAGLLDDSGKLNQKTSDKFSKLDSMLFTPEQIAEAGNPWGAAITAAGVTGGIVAGAAITATIIAAGGFGGAALLGTIAAGASLVPVAGWIVAGVCAIAAGAIALGTALDAENKRKEQEKQQNENIDNFISEFNNLTDDELHLYYLRSNGALLGVFESLYEVVTDDKVKAKIEELVARLDQAIGTANSVNEYAAQSLQDISDAEDYADAAGTVSDEIYTGLDVPNGYSSDSMGTDGVGSANPADSGVTGAIDSQSDANQRLNSEALGKIQDAKAKLNEIINNPLIPESIKDMAREALKKLEEAENKIDEVNNGVDDALALADEAVKQANAKIKEVLDNALSSNRNVVNSVNEVNVNADASLSAGNGTNALNSAVFATEKAPQAIELAQSTLDDLKQLLNDFQFEGNLPEFVEAKAILETYVADAQKNVDDAKEAQTKAEQAKANSLEKLKTEAEEYSGDVANISSNAAIILEPQKTAGDTLQTASITVDSAKIKADAFPSLDMVETLINQGTEVIANASQTIDTASAPIQSIAEIKSLVDENGTPEAKAQIAAIQKKAETELQKAKDELDATIKTQESLVQKFSEMQNKVTLLPDEIAKENINGINEELYLQDNIGLDDDSEVENEEGVDGENVDEDEDYTGGLSLVLPDSDDDGEDYTGGLDLVLPQDGEEEGVDGEISATDEVISIGDETIIAEGNEEISDELQTADDLEEASSDNTEQITDSDKADPAEDSVVTANDGSQVIVLEPPSRENPEFVTGDIDIGISVDFGSDGNIFEQGIQDKASDNTDSIQTTENEDESAPITTDDLQDDTKKKPDEFFVEIDE